jgi:hypothetical protein
VRSEPPKSRDDTPVVEPQRMTVDHLRRAADRWRDLSDSMLMTKVWDEPATPDAQSVTNAPRRFGQLQNLSVPDNFDDPLPDAEIAAWEGDSHSETQAVHPISRKALRRTALVHHTTAELIAALGVRPRCLCAIWLSTMRVTARALHVAHIASSGMDVRSGALRGVLPEGDVGDVQNHSHHWCEQRNRRGYRDSSRR